MRIREAMESPDDFMLRCIELGRMAKQSDDAPVGSLIVCEGKLLSEGLESVRRTMDPTAHAEIEAIRAACRVLKSLDLRRCTLYTTAEPCWMCSYAIRSVRISHVVIGAPVPYVGGATSHHSILTDPEVGCWPGVPTVTWSGSCKDTIVCSERED